MDIKMYAFFIAIWLSHHGAYAMEVFYRIELEANGIPQLPSIQSSDGTHQIEPFVNKLVNYQAVYDAYLQEGYSRAQAEKAIKEYLEELASHQSNYE